MSEIKITLGAEIERPYSEIRTGKPHGVSPNFFPRIVEKTGGKLKYSDIEPDTVLGVTVPGIGEVGLDNARNLGETATIVTGDLEQLGLILDEDLKLIQETLANEGATTINMSTHPLCGTDEATYEAFVAPKGVYKYIWKRGWNHAVGIDAKAQNSPCTGVNPVDAATAVTTIIGAGAAFIGLFANSPFEEKKVSEYKETRLNMWEPFMCNSISEGDRKTAQFPENPFFTMKDYFEWMFGKGTNIHFVIASGVDYKSFGEAAVLIDGNPSVLDYLKMENAQGQFMTSGEQVMISPDLSHVEAMQFSQFSGARIRWQFNHEKIDIPMFIKAIESNKLEDLFESGGVNFTYIEGRDPGANFPDQQLIDIDPEMAKSVVIAPSAIQTGLLANLKESHNFIMTYPWKQLNTLRDAAIKYGLDGSAGDLSVKFFAEKILEIASKGISSNHHNMLTYPKHVLASGQNGADRAIVDYESGKSIKDIVVSRNVVIPS